MRVCPSFVFSCHLVGAWCSSLHCLCSHWTSGVPNTTCQCASKLAWHLPRVALVSATFLSPTLTAALCCMAGSWCQFIALLLEREVFLCPLISYIIGGGRIWLPGSLPLSRTKSIVGEKTWLPYGVAHLSQPVQSWGFLCACPSRMCRRITLKTFCYFWRILGIYCWICSLLSSLYYL